MVKSSTAQTATTETGIREIEMGHWGSESVDSENRNVPLASRGVDPSVNHEALQEDLSGKWTAIAILGSCEVAGMALWFSASAVLPSIAAENPMTPLEESLFTTSVIVGFIIGTFLSALFSLPDRLDVRRFFSAGAAVGALANALILVLPPASLAMYSMRFITGMCCAAIYPVGMKMAATWQDGDLGLLVAILVGALTLGSASPHLFNAMGGVAWRFTIAATSFVSAMAALAIFTFRLGPMKKGPTPPLDLGSLTKAFTQRPLLLSNLGYIGHVWELYAMWAWIGVFYEKSFSERGLQGVDPQILARAATFFVMGIGGVGGALCGGWMADRFGRTRVTVLAMSVSGCMAIVTGFLFGWHPLILILAGLVWGISIIADSAQFSACVFELSEPQLIGTMVTVQTTAGYSMSLLTVSLVPIIEDVGGWPAAFSFLAIGPAWGVVAMMCLQRLPEARKLAGGRG